MSTKNTFGHWEKKALEGRMLFITAVNVIHVQSGNDILDSEIYPCTKFLNNIISSLSPGIIVNMFTFFP